MKTVRSIVSNCFIVLFGFFIVGCADNSPAPRRVEIPVTTNSNVLRVVNPERYDVIVTYRDEVTGETESQVLKPGAEYEFDVKPLKRPPYDPYYTGPLPVVKEFVPERRITFTRMNGHNKVMSMDVGRTTIDGVQYLCPIR